MLIFSLKKQWYEKIKSGEKTIEYREVKPYWKTRLWHNNCLPSKEFPYEYEKVRSLTFPVDCILQCGYDPKTRLEAFVKKVEIVDGKSTDLHIDKPVYAIHLAGVKQKMSLQEEIKRIHDEYYNGGKFIKPSFKYIVVISQTLGQHGDDFYVCNHLDKAKEKALELLSLTKDWVEIYEVREYKDGFKAVEIFTIHSFDKVFRESFSSSQPMHIAWRTRGDCLNEKEK